MKISCIAIEDEPLALKKISEYIEMVDYLDLKGCFSSAIEAIGFLKRCKVDLIFLDIQMKKLSGIQFMESVKPEAKVIITSAYGEYAIKGFELDVADYLLKPFAFDRFLKSVEKVSKAIQERGINDSKGFIFVRTEYRVEKVELRDILYIKGMKDYLQISTTHSKIMTLQTFRKILEVLPAKEFIRVHNSYIVSFSKIESIERNRIRIGEQIIPISEGYKDIFYQVLKEKGILL